MSFLSAEFKKQSKDSDTWGQESFCLGLPGFNVQFSGLSTSQKNILLVEFERFLLDQASFDSALSQETRLVCEAVKLDVPLDIPIEQLQDGNQYSPNITKQDGAISIVGNDFTATFACEAAPIVSAQLAVAKEHELTSMSVIENFLRIYSAYNAVALSGAVLHSAGLVFDNKAMVFVGYSNVGKTTLTRKAYSHGYTVLSDDINLVLPGDSGYRAYKVPFTGEFGRTVDDVGISSSFPLNGIALLEQGDKVSAQLVDPVYAVSRLIAGSPFVNTDEHQIPLLFDIYSALVETIPIVKLSLPLKSNIDDIYNVMYKTMSA